MRPSSLLLAALLIAACAQENPGTKPPTDRFHFPTSVAVVETTPGLPGMLYVVSSNFDLRYNRGTVLAVDLSRFPGVPDGSVADKIDQKNGFVKIDNFAAKNALYTPAGATSAGARRMFVPTRFNQLLFALDLDGPVINCFGTKGPVAGRDCLEAGISLVQSETIRAEDPFGVVVQGRDVYVSHLRAVADPPITASTANSPRAAFLVHLDAEIPAALDFINIGSAPADALVAAPSGIYFTGRVPGSPQSGETRPLRRLVGGNTFEDVAVGESTRIKETRGLAVSSDGNRLFLSARTCASNTCSIASSLLSGLVVVDISPDAATGGPRNQVVGFTELPRGASDLAVVARPGQRDLVAVSCGDSDTVALYDDDLGQVVALVPGIASPYGIAQGSRSAGGARLFVASFNNHTVDVVDVPDLTRPRTASVVGRIGVNGLPLGVDAPRGAP